MLSETEARERIMGRVAPLPRECVPLLAAQRRHAASAVVATVALPGFDNSQVDGYALRSGDAVAGAHLSVVAEYAAGGSSNAEVTPGSAIRIFTGAPIPLGADAVIMQEDVRRDGEHIRLNAGVEAGENIRRTGSDLCRGQRLLNAGDRISAVTLGLLASQGLTEVQVHRNPAVAVVSTGDELVAPGGSLLPSQIYNSNAVMLRALLIDAGVTQIETAHCRDDLDETIATLRRVLHECDAVLISGGVSVGERDFVKPALQALGVETEFWRVNIKPGKPFLFGAAGGDRRASVFGLPGNPVSSFVTYHRFVRPALMRMLGAPVDRCGAADVRAELVEKIVNDGGRPHFVRGRLLHGKFREQGSSRVTRSLACLNAMPC